MEYLHPSSTPASKSELLLFNVPPTQVAIDSKYDVEYRPAASLESSTVHEINIPASEDFTDLSQTMLTIHLDVQDAAGAKVTGDNVKCIDNFGNSLFEQIDFFLGTINTSQASNSYHYTSYFEDLLFRYPTKADVSRYDKSVVVKDDIRLFFRLHLPMCEQDKLLVNGMPMLFRFVRSPDSFTLIATDKVQYKIKITKLALHIKRVKLFPDIQTNILSTLNNTPANYFIIRNEVKTFSLNKGLSAASIENVFAGILPRRIVIGFVDENGFSGNYAYDPYKFENVNINQIMLNVDGSLIPTVPYQPNFPNGCIREFVDLYRTLGQDEGGPQLNLSFDEYKTKTTLFGFDISGPLGGEFGNLSLLKRGSVRLEMRFTNETTKQYKVIVFAQFDNLISIDKDRNVILDY